METRWQMVRGAEEFPGRAAAFGVMGLRGAALERGAGLAGVTIEAARRDPVANIRAAAAVREVMGGLYPNPRFVCPRVRDTDTVCILYVHDTGDSADGPQSPQDIEH